MNARVAAILSCTAVLGIGAAASADVVTGTITADNHYALYSSTGGVFSYHGGNELGAGGNPGTYNWSMAEPYQFEAGNFVYIAAWSDDSVAQGVLAEFNVPGLGAILSGDPRWQVYATNINRGDGDAHPDAGEIASHVNFADANFLWESIYAGGNNGIQPWGTIAGITESAQWMWRGSPNVADPLTGGFGQSEMLIFRTQIPTPGAMAILGLGGMVAARRRRMR